MSAVRTPAEDLVVLLDEWGLPAGTAARASVHTDATPLHLAFSCYVFDRADRLLVTRRAPAKTFGGTWTNSFCGHPRPGECLEDAVVRRAHDELRLDLAEVRLVLPGFRYRAEQDGIVENEMCPVFTARAVGAMSPDPAEIDDFAWVEWDEFSEQVCSGDREISPWCRTQIRLLRDLGRPGTWWPASAQGLPPAAQRRASVHTGHVGARRASAAPAAAPESVLDLAAAEDLGRRVDEQIEALLARETAAFDAIDPAVGEFAREAAAAVVGGKRLRAVVAYWGWRGAGGDPSDAMAAAAASLELLHAFALTHDDVMDDSDVRRGRPATHRRFAALHRLSGWSGSDDGFGLAAAILAGDACMAWADALLTRSGLSDDALRRGRPVYDAMRSELVAGQYLDLVQQVRGTRRLEDALTVARYKTAGYTIERPLHLGGALAGADVGLIGAYRAYGQALGQAYQLRDDIIGTFGDPAVTGKPAGDDIRSGKGTALVALALELGGPSAQGAIRAALGDPLLDEADLARVRDVLVDVGAVGRVERLIEEFSGAAAVALERADVTASARRMLERLIAAATRRDL